MKIHDNLTYSCPKSSVLINEEKTIQNKHITHKINIKLATSEWTKEINRPQNNISQQSTQSQKELRKVVSYPFLKKGLL